MKKNKNEIDFEKIIKEANVEMDKLSSVEEIEEIVKIYRDLDKRLTSPEIALDPQDNTDKLAYIEAKIALSMEDTDTILENLKKDPETFAAIDPKFFRDYAFVADAIEVAMLAAKKRNHKLAKDTFKMLSEDKKKSDHPENYAPFSKKEMEDSQNEAFALRVALKLERANKELEEEQREHENSPEYQAQLNVELEYSKLRTSAIAAKNGRTK